MKRYIILLISCAMCILCTSCNSPAEERQISLNGDVREITSRKIELKNVTDKFIPARIYNIGDNIVLMQKNITNIPTTYIFDIDGNLLCEGLYLGRGPQDINGLDVRFFSKAEDGFLLLEQSNSICKVFLENKRLKIIDRQVVDMPFGLNGVVDLGNDKFCCLDLSESDTELNIISTKPDFETLSIGKYPPQSSGDIFLNNMIGVGMPQKEKFAYFYNFLGKFKIYSNEGDLLQDVCIGDVKSQQIIENPQERIVYFMSACANDEYIYTSYLECEYQKRIDLPSTRILKWDWNGNLVEQYKTDALISYMTITENNQLVGINTYSDENILYIYDM